MFYIIDDVLDSLLKYDSRKRWKKIMKNHVNAMGLCNDMEGFNYAISHYGKGPIEHGGWEPCFVYRIKDNFFDELIRGRNLPEWDGMKLYHKIVSLME